MTFEDEFDEFINKTFTFAYHAIVPEDETMTSPLLLDETLLKPLPPPIKPKPQTPDRLKSIISK